VQTSSLLGHVEEIHDAILGSDRPADALFREFFRGRRYLGAADRRFVAETTYALVRYALLLDALAARAGAAWAGSVAARVVALGARGKLPVERSDLLAAAEGRAGRALEGFARLAREARLLDAPAVDSIAFDESFPIWMVDELVARFGEAGARSLAAALNAPAPIALRANRLVVTRGELLRELAAEGIEARAAPRAPDGVILARRTNVFASPAFRAGRFEVQDEGSQLVSAAIDPHPGWRVLDACAGAGGKTLHLAAIMEGRGELFAHEPDARRREELRRRVRRAGAQNVRIVAAADAEPLRGRMEVVLVDAPCSGAGTIRRNPMIKNRLRREDLARHAAEQLAILVQWAPFVAPGGLLAYATCSLFREENEAVAERFLARAPGFVVESTRLWRPDVDGTDGFYVAHLRAPGAPRVPHDRERAHQDDEDDRLLEVSLHPGQAPQPVP